MGQGLRNEFTVSGQQFRVAFGDVRRSRFAQFNAPVKVGARQKVHIPMGNDNTTPGQPPMGTNGGRTTIVDSGTMRWSASKTMEEAAISEFKSQVLGRPSNSRIGRAPSDRIGIRRGRPNNWGRELTPNSERRTM